MTKVSPSQIANLLDCHRKWFYSSVLRIPRPQHPSAAKGEKVHKILEGYLETGQIVAPMTPDGPELAAIAESGIMHLPDPAHHKIGIEGTWSFVHSSGGHDWIYTGRKDFDYDDAAGIWTVGDHKTSSNIKAYSLDEARLAVDPQGVLYAADGMRKQGRDTVNLRWVYYSTKRPYRSKLVAVTMAEEHVETELAKLDDIVIRKILPLVHEKDLPPKEVEPTLTACDKYGGCPYRNICDRSPMARIRHLFPTIETTTKGPDDMNALERLQALKAMRTNPTTTTEPGAGTDINPPEYQPPALTEAKAPETPADSPAPAPTETEPTKAKRTRGPNKPKPVESTEPAHVSTPRVVLFVDATLDGSLEGSSVVHVSRLYQATTDTLKTDEGVEDYSFVDYGKGSGMFALVFKDQLEKCIGETEGQTLVLLADTGAREWPLVNATLRNRADSIVRGYGR